MLTYDMERRGRLPLYDYLCRCIKEDIWNLRKIRVFRFG